MRNLFTQSQQLGLGSVGTLSFVFGTLSFDFGALSFVFGSRLLFLCALLHLVGVSHSGGGNLLRRWNACARFGVSQPKLDFVTFQVQP